MMSGVLKCPDCKGYNECFHCPRHLHLLGAPPQDCPHGRGEEVGGEGEAGADQEDHGACKLACMSLKFS